MVTGTITANVKRSQVQEAIHAGAGFFDWSLAGCLARS